MPKEDRSFSTAATIDAKPIQISIYALVAFACIGLSVFHHQITDDKKREDIVFTCTLISAGVAGVAAFQALKSYKYNLRQYGIDRSLIYMDKWVSTEYKQARKTVDSVIKEVEEEANNGKKAAKLNELLEKNEDNKQAVVNILNLLDQMAIGINAGILNEEILHQFYRYIVLRSWDSLKSYATMRRAQIEHETGEESPLFKPLENLSECWRNNTSAYQADV